MKIIQVLNRLVQTHYADSEEPLTKGYSHKHRETKDIRLTRRQIRTRLDTGRQAIIGDQDFAEGLVADDNLVEMPMRIDRSKAFLNRLPLMAKRVGGLQLRRFLKAVGDLRKSRARMQQLIETILACSHFVLDSIGLYSKGFRSLLGSGRNEFGPEALHHNHPLGYPASSRSPHHTASRCTRATPFSAASVAATAW